MYQVPWTGEEGMYLEIVRKECTWEGSGGLPDSQQASLVCSSAASAMLSFVITLAGAYKQVTNIYKTVTPNGKKIICRSRS